MKLVSYKKRAINKNLEYNLTSDWLKTKLAVGICEATGLPFKYRPKNSTLNPFLPSIDRIDSNKGYTRENCRVVITAFNLLKSDFDEETLEIFCKNFISKYEKDNS